MPGPTLLAHMRKRSSDTSSYPWASGEKGLVSQLESGIDILDLGRAGKRVIRAIVE